MNNCVITADIRKSRDSENRRELQDNIFSLLKQVNEQFHNDILVPFNITLGDEWQGVLHNLSQSYRIAATFLEELHPYSLSIGIAEGKIETEIKDRSVEMDGQVFHRCREAITKAKKEGSEIIYFTNQPQIDLLLNVSCRLLQLARQNWTERQLQKIILYKRLKKELDVAKQLKVSQADINQTLAATNARVYIESENKINDFLSLKI